MGDDGVVITGDDGVVITGDGGVVTRVMKRFISESERSYQR
jgi:hypothetical protein